MLAPLRRFGLSAGSCGAMTVSAGPLSFVATEALCVCLALGAISWIATSLPGPSSAGLVSREPL